MTHEHEPSTPDAEASVSVTIPGHGTYSAPASAVDRAIAHYLPSSPVRLRSIVENRAGLAYGAWDAVLDVSAFLIVLADFDAPAR